MFAPCINSIKALFIVPPDAHNYKIIGVLKQLKFRQLLQHVSVHSGTIIRELFHEPKHVGAIVKILIVLIFL